MKQNDQIPDPGKITKARIHQTANQRVPSLNHSTI